VNEPRHREVFHVGHKSIENVYRALTWDWPKDCDHDHRKPTGSAKRVSNADTTKPADLTQLAKQNGRTFPGVKVMRGIDGRDEVRTHGTSDMPVWGERFRAESAAVHT
jgi:hypothetical protein